MFDESCSARGDLADLNTRLDVLREQGTWLLNDELGLDSCFRELGQPNLTFVHIESCAESRVCNECANRLVERHLEYMCLSERLRRSMDVNWAHLQNLRGACSSDVCRQTLEQILSSAESVREVPIMDDYVSLFFSGVSIANMSYFFSTRPCGQQGLPCMSQLVGAVQDSSNALELKDRMAAVLNAPLVSVVNQTLEKELLEMAEAASMYEKCGFGEGADFGFFERRSGYRRCRRQSDLVNSLRRMLNASAPLYFSQQLDDLVSLKLSACRSNCLMDLNLKMHLQRSLATRRLISISAYVTVRRSLWTPFARELLDQFPEPSLSPLQIVLTAEFLPWNLIIVGLVFFCILAAACIGSVILVLVVWKVPLESCWIYLLILALMLVGAVFNIVQWAHYLRVFQSYITTDFSRRMMVNLIFRQLAVFPDIVLYCVYVVLSINWLFALIALGGRLKLSDRGGKILISVFVFVAAVLAVPFAISGFLFNRPERNWHETALNLNSDFSLAAIVASLELVFQVALLLLSLFVCASSIVGLLLVRKSDRGTQNNLVGLKKMVACSSVLLVCIIVQFVYSMLDGQVVRLRTYGFPVWFEYGLILIGLRVVVYAALFFLVLEASHILRRKVHKDMDNEDGFVPLLEERKVPAQYEI